MISVSEELLHDGVIVLRSGNLQYTVPDLPFFLLIRQCKM